MEDRLNECLRLALAHNVSDIHFNVTKEKVIIEMRLSDRIRRLKSNPND
jgi:type II secretory ATPase GspE/PulE/Tfp pilus assembly ATPase PilB-like protein